MSSLVLKCLRFVPRVKMLVLVVSPIVIIILSIIVTSIYQERLSTAQFYRQVRAAKMDITRMMAQLQEPGQWSANSLSAASMKKIRNGEMEPRDVSFIRSQFILVNSSPLPLTYSFVYRTLHKQTSTTDVLLQNGAGPQIILPKIVGMDNRSVLNLSNLDLARFSFSRRPEMWNFSKFVKEHGKDFRCSVGLCFEPDINPSQNGIPKIPRIIHQTWVNSSVPEITVKWIKKWLEMNPGYQYWLWTDRGINNFINYKYKEYKHVFKRYRKQIEIADAIRYFIMYQFGGIYADLDIEALKSFDPLVFRYPCLLSLEPDEHALLLRPAFTNHLHMLTSNAIMMCRPHHAFFKHIIGGLIARTFLGGTLWRTGPAGMAKDFQSYLSLKRNDLCDSAKDRVAVTSQELLIPEFDPKDTKTMKAMCRTKRYARQKLRRIVCKKLAKNKFRNVISNSSFATHHWIHTWTPRGVDYKEGGGQQHFVQIQDIIPHVNLPYEAMESITETYPRHV